MKTKAADAPVHTFDSPVGIGDLVKDKITGFQGIVTAVTFWLNGCRRVVVQPRELRGGDKGDAFSMPSTENFDVEQIDVIQTAAVVIEKPASESRTGGPHPAPVRGHDPR